MPFFLPPLPSFFEEFYCPPKGAKDFKSLAAMNVSPMYGYLVGFSSPESIFAEKILISCFVTKTGNMLFFPKNRKYVIFPKIALFHINCYFIGKVSPMYGFLAGFSSP